MNQSTFGR